MRNISLIEEERRIDILEEALWSSHSRNSGNHEVELTRERERMDAYSALAERGRSCIHSLSEIYEQEDRMGVYRDVRDEVRRCHMPEEEAFQRTRGLREQLLRDKVGVRQAFGWLETLRTRVELISLQEESEHLVELAAHDAQQTRNAFEVLIDLHDDR